MNPKLLQKMIQGDVFFDDETLRLYSVDSSSFVKKPKIVTVPKNQDDIIQIVKFSQKNHVPITVRGAGTGLVGGAIGNGIIIDTKNLCNVRVSKNHVIVDAGTPKGLLDLFLHKSGKFLGVNPSIGPYCTVGGMIACNASGSKSLKYGSMIDNLIEVTMVTSKGTVEKFPSDSALSDKIMKIAKTVSCNDYPDVSKNSCGYRLDVVNKKSEIHKVIAGSEGTLGIITSAKLKIFDIPKCRVLYIIEYSSLQDAASDCPEMVKLKPSSVEIVDKNILKNINHTFDKKTTCLLFVEFDSEISRNNLKIQKITSSIYRKITEQKEIDQWWQFRDHALSYSIKNISNDKKIPHIIEDGTVPVSRLPDVIIMVNELCKSYHVKPIIYGHAGNGNLHIRLIGENDKRIVNKIARKFFSNIINLGGSISGEHGDGIARTPFVTKQYKSKTITKFKKLKESFDKNNLLNPGKIIKI